uniref:Uncharacterized protein n=1 Tax=Solanum lycopersicum TaxID=4081 RepID=A0A3Q7FVK5_SOLLC
MIANILKGHTPNATSAAFLTMCCLLERMKGLLYCLLTKDGTDAIAASLLPSSSSIETAPDPTLTRFALWQFIRVFGSTDGNGPGYNITRAL